MANEKRLDLIDRKALGIGYANPLVFDKTEYAHGWNCAIEILMKAPTVDAVEVVHARWEDANGIPKSKCGNCRVEFGRIMAYDCDYCPKCGAKMDGDGNG